MMWKIRLCTKKCSLAAGNECTSSAKYGIFWICWKFWISPVRYYIRAQHFWLFFDYIFPSLVWGCQKGDNGPYVMTTFFQTTNLCYKVASKAKILRQKVCQKIEFTYESEKFSNCYCKFCTNTEIAGLRVPKARQNTVLL